MSNNLMIMLNHLLDKEIDTGQGGWPSTTQAITLAMYNFSTVNINGHYLCLFCLSGW